MNLIKLVNIVKRYKLANGRSFLALKNINITFPSRGFISILGKSGCGKSTLLNIIGLMDEPTNGNYYFNDRDMGKLSRLEKEDYLNQKIGIVFQHYYLIEDKDVLFNIALPSLINGTSYKDACEDAITLLKGIDFDENLLHKKVSNLSGGEKQRVAILRALINSPNIILCDEPTGALDTDNSLRIMEILKNASKTKLVIMVSHNEELVNEYSDRIITIKDGAILSDTQVKEINHKTNPIVSDYSKKRKDRWVEQISTHNFKKRIKTHIFSIISLSICLVATILIAGFARYSQDTINKESKRKIDYGSLTISKEEKIDLEGSVISLVQQSRPSENETLYLKENNDKFFYTYNYDVLLPGGRGIQYEDIVLDQIIMRPIYSYNEGNVDESLLLKGEIPINDTFDCVLINKQAYEYIKKVTKKDILNQELTIKHEYESVYYSFNQDNNVVRDTYSLLKNLKIVGIVDEMDFLSTPTIYFSYKSYIKYLESYLLNNLSNFFNKDISWKQRIETCGDNDELSSYSIRAFLKDYHDNENLKKLIEEISEDNLVATSLSLTVENSLIDLVNASTTGMELFLVISILGIVLILGIISYYSYSQDRKRSAILSALGASKGAIMKIYLLENMIVGLFSFFLTIIISFPITILVNYLVNKLTSINDLVRTPYYLFTSFKYDYLLFVLLAIILIVVLATFIPIFFSKKISISEELRDE